MIRLLVKPFKFNLRAVCVYISLTLITEPTGSGKYVHKGAFACECSGWRMSNHIASKK